jgi:hypothetical protein
MIGRLMIKMMIKSGKVGRIYVACCGDGGAKDKQRWW